MPTFASVYFLIDKEVYCADKIEQSLLESLALLDERADVYFAPKRIELATGDLKADVDAIVNERSENVRAHKTENYTPKEFVRHDNTKEDDERESAPLACICIDYTELLDPGRRAKLSKELASVKNEFAGFILIATAAPTKRISFNDRKLLEEIGEAFSDVKNEAWIRVFFASFERYCDGSIVCEPDLIDWLTTLMAQDLVPGESDIDNAAIYRDPDPDKFTIDVLGGRAFHIDVDGIRKALTSRYWDGMMRKVNARREKWVVHEDLKTAEGFLDDLCKEAILIEKGSPANADLVRKSDGKLCVFRPVEYHEPIRVKLNAKATKRDYEYACDRVNEEIAATIDKLDQKWQKIVPNIGRPLKRQLAESVIAGKGVSEVTKDYVKKTEGLVTWQCKAEKPMEQSDVDLLLDALDHVWDRGAVFCYFLCSFAFVGMLTSSYLEMIRWHGLRFLAWIAVCGVATVLAFAMGLMIQKRAIKRAQEAVDNAFADCFKRFSFEISKKVEQISQEYLQELQALSGKSKSSNGQNYIDDARKAEQTLKTVFAPVAIFSGCDSPSNLFSFKRLPDLERYFVEQNAFYSDDNVEDNFRLLRNALEEYFRAPNVTNLDNVVAVRSHISNYCSRAVNEALQQVDFEFYLRDNFDSVAASDRANGVKCLLERIVLSRACVFARGPLVAELANTIDEPSVRDIKRKKFYIAPRMCPETQAAFQNEKPNDVTYRESGLEGSVLSAAVLRIYQDNPGL